jgi:hypothetical protein
MKKQVLSRALGVATARNVAKRTIRTAELVVYRHANNIEIPVVNRKQETGNRPEWRFPSVHP